MIISSNFITDGISDRLILKLLERHQAKLGRYQLLDEYYRGKHAIDKRIRNNPDAPNNRVVANYAKYITDMSVGYLLGSPVSYNAQDNADITLVIDNYTRQTMEQKDAEIAKGVSKFGKCYELIYANGQAQPASAIITPFHGFIVYDDTVEHNKLFGVHYYPHTDVDGSVKSYSITLYTDRSIRVYHTTGAFLSNLVFEEEYVHFFGDVPMIEYINNREEQGDYEQLISLIDAYDILQSDRINDKEQFVNAFLLLVGVDVDSEDVKRLKREKILMAPDDGRAEYLSKVMAESDVEVLRKAVNSDIHKFSAVPDMTDEKFSGNLSGVAIRYKLLTFEQHTKNKERYFEMGLKERFVLYNAFLNVKQNMRIMDKTDVECIFSRNLPVNELELSQMIVNLKDRVSEETLLAQLSFVKKPAEEAERVKQQRQEAQQAQAELFGGLGGFRDEQTSIE